MHLARVPGMGDLSDGDAHAFEKSLHRCSPAVPIPGWL